MIPMPFAEMMRDAPFFGFTMPSIRAKHRIKADSACIVCGATEGVAVVPVADADLPLCGTCHDNALDSPDSAMRPHIKRYRALLDMVRADADAEILAQWEAKHG